MNSKFTDLCNLVLENVDRTLKENYDEPVYQIIPDLDRESITGPAKLVADFTDVKPATIDEIIEALKTSGEMDDETAANVVRNLIDSNSLQPAELTAPEPVEAEPTPGDLAAAEVPDEAASATAPVVPSEDDEEAEAEVTKPLVTTPPPVAVEEPEADGEDEENLDTGGIRSQLDTDSEEDELDDDDDTPVGELIRKENQNRQKKEQQMERMMRFVLSKRGKSPEEIEQYITQMRARKAQSAPQPTSPRL